MKNCDDSCSYLGFERIYVTKDDIFEVSSMSDLESIAKGSEKDPVFVVLKGNRNGFIQQENKVSYFSVQNGEGCSIMDYVEQRVEDYVKTNKLSEKKKYIVTDSPLGCCLNKKLESGKGAVLYFSYKDGKIEIEKYKTQKSNILPFPSVVEQKQIDRYAKFIE